MKKPLIKGNKLFSIQSRLFITYFILIIFIIGFIGAASLKIPQEIIEKQVADSRVEVLNQIGRNMNIIINEIISVSNLYYFDNDIMNIIKKPSATDSFEKYKDLSKMLEIFSKYTGTFDNLNLQYYCIIYGSTGRKYSSWISDSYNFDSILKRPWYSEIIEKNGNILWISTFNDREGYGEDKYVFSAARVLKDDYSNNSLGLLLLNVDESVMCNTYLKTGNKESNIYIFDKSGNIVSHRDKSKLGTNMFHNKYINEINTGIGDGYKIVNGENGKLLVSFIRIPRVEWTIVEEVPLSIVLAPMAAMKYIIMSVLLICIIIGMVMAYLIAKQISKPVKSLYYSMKEVGAGNLNISSDIKSNDEIGELSAGFNKMVVRIRELIEKAVREEQLKRKAEYQFLQAQINPHFLYNTLNSIKCMVAMNDKKAGEHLIVALVRLLRKILSNEDELITIREEIDILKDYVLIQTYRYGDKFEVRFDIDECVWECLILKFILQPIVENAIFHGIEPKGDKGGITIRCTRVDEDILFEVEDNGVGMSEEVIRSVWAEEDSLSNRTFNSIGINNVHGRIILNFGNKYGLKISSKLNKGTSVKIRLPVVESEGRIEKGC